MRLHLQLPLHRCQPQVLVLLRRQHQRQHLWQPQSLGPLLVLQLLMLTGRGREIWS